MFATAALVATAISSRAQLVNMSLVDYTTLTVAQVGGTVGGTEMPDAYLGIYGFSGSQVVNGSISGLANNFAIQSICLSPLGDLTTGTYQYNYETFAAANPGANPSAWQWNQNNSNPQYWGIQNANYLWLKNSAAIEQAGNATGAAALMLAMYDALYNSTGYGTVGTGTPTKGFLPNFASTAEQNDYTAYVNSLTAAGVEANLANGYVFVPTDNNPGGPSGQSFIILSPGETLNVVPEPTTMIAGALLLLPFGASTLRILRKKHA